MQIHQVQSQTKRKRARQVARGGKRGKTAGRGHKGQNARAGTSKRPEIRDMIKKLPKRRGETINRSAHKALKVTAQPLTLTFLSKHFPEGGEVTPQVLLEKGLITLSRGKIPALKVLGTGEATVALTVSGIAVSKAAQTKIEAAKGSVK